MYLLSGLWVIWCGVVGFLGCAAIVLIWWFDIGWPHLQALLRGTTLEKEKEEENLRWQAQNRESVRKEAERKELAEADRVKRKALLMKKGGILAIILVNQLKDERLWDAEGRPDREPYSKRRGLKMSPLTPELREAALKWEARQKSEGVWSPEIENERQFDDVCGNLWIKYAWDKRRDYKDLRWDYRDFIDWDEVEAMNDQIDAMIRSIYKT